MKIEIEVDVPEGYELVASNPSRQRIFAYDGIMLTSVDLRFRAKPRHPTEADVGKEVEVGEVCKLTGKLLAVHGDCGWVDVEGGPLTYRLRELRLR